MAGLSVFIVLLYVLIAKSTFEHDKISYVFDTQQTQADLLSRSLSKKIENLAYQSQQLASSYLQTNSAFSKNATQGLTSHASFFIYDTKSDRLVYQYGEIVQPLSPPESWPTLSKAEPIQIQISTDNGLWQIFTEIEPANGQKLKILVITSIADELNNLREAQGIALAQETDLMPMRASPFDLEKLRDPILKAVNAQQFASTFELAVKNETLLISQGILSLKKYKIVIFSNTKDALAALDLLFKRSIFFLIFSLSFIFGISFFLARKLTSTLTSLTASAEKIGQGNFSSETHVTSNDEIGLLADSFETMKDKIRDLLNKTKETVRMEQELKTAKLVQESLFPKNSVYKMNSIALKGHFQTSSECGGDWWYYFTRGDDLYITIADATGHGTPAALITSTARSCFSFFEKRTDSIAQMMEDWSAAVAACSNQRVFMTGMIFRINTKTGAFDYINACHEPPFHFKNQKNLFYAEPLDVEKNKTLGEEKQIEWMVSSGQLQPSEKLMIFTDGLFAITNPEGTVLSEKRALKQIQKFADSAQSIEEFADQSIALFEKHRQGEILPDDVTLIFVEKLLDSKTF